MASGCPDTPANLASMTPARLAEEREVCAGKGGGGNPTAVAGATCCAALAFLLENPSDSELWDLPEVKEIMERNQEWVVREIDRCAYGRREQKPTKILTGTNRPKWVPMRRRGGQATIGAGRECAPGG